MRFHFLKIIAHPNTGLIVKPGTWFKPNFALTESFANNELERFARIAPPHLSRRPQFSGRVTRIGVKLSLFWKDQFVSLARVSPLSDSACPQFCNRAPSATRAKLPILRASKSLTYVAQSSNPGVENTRLRNGRPTDARNA